MFIFTNVLASEYQSVRNVPCYLQQKRHTTESVVLHIDTSNF